MNTAKEIIESDLYMMSEDIKKLLDFYAKHKSAEEANEICNRLRRRVEDIRVRL